MTKKRQSNLELFRCIVMLLIIAHHYVVNSGLLDKGGGGFMKICYPQNHYIYWFLVRGEKRGLIVLL